MRKKLDKLSPLQREVTQNNATETPFKNEYNNFFEKGVYVDIVSGNPLFLSESKFDSGCGWPSFDQALDTSVLVEKVDNSLARTRQEIRSTIADSHLGHVFNDGPTPTGLRYCVNSAAVKFIALDDFDTYGLSHLKSLLEDDPFSYIYFGAGCFWGVEYHFSQLVGVLEVKSGYMGGSLIDPTYQEICQGDTGHAEVVMVKYDPRIISFELLLDYFWRMHDPTTLNRQGPDHGEQYRSVVFYTSKEQKDLTLESIRNLTNDKVFPNPIVTQVSYAARFFQAEDYHQDYFMKKHGGKGPVCHRLRSKVELDS